ncbi:MAG: peptidoglycan DD-metalloendopeptidase family protein [Pseudomonadales bacterium]|nr:peptidoglycan DD-metalloendopeptidase family protein [Pseudomonadales bacterium]
MKIILLRDGGFNRSLHLSRRKLAAFASGALVAAFAVVAFVVMNFQTDAVDAEVVADWRAKLSKQDQVVAQLERKSTAQSTAVGRQLAEMQARLLRMEAIGAHMVSELDTPEFDFAAVPAQGGPVTGSQSMLAWNELQRELAELSLQLRKRETELNILDSVLVSEEIAQSSDVSGRPVNWGWLSSQYGQRVDPITGKEAWHSGVDFAGRDGSDVIAVASGVVTYSGERSGYGRMVEISHANGFVTRYGHHKALLVSTGDVVKKGEAIGKMGSSGRSTGPHVHFEVLKHGRTLDPAKFVARRS